MTSINDDRFGMFSLNCLPSTNQMAEVTASFQASFRATKTSDLMPVRPVNARQRK